jgi:GntR family transcriptional regulator
VQRCLACEADGVATLVFRVTASRPDGNRRASRDLFAYHGLSLRLFCFCSLLCFLCLFVAIVDLASSGGPRKRGSAPSLTFVHKRCTNFLFGYSWYAMLRIDLASRVPVYEQIANGLRAELVSGKFSPGEKLPTVRTLAINLGVHHNTVAEAYRQLANEGWLELKRHHGAIVRKRDQPEAGPDTMERFTRPLRELVAKGLADGLSPSSLAREMIETARGLEVRTSP